MLDESIDDGGAESSTDGTVDGTDDGEAVEGAAGAADVVDKEVMVMLQFRSRRCFLSSHVSTKIYPLL